jgi:hypothetical protein
MDYLAIIGVAIGILGIFLSIYFYLKTVRKKKLSFLFENNTIFNQDNVVEKLNVTYDNKKLNAFSNAKVLLVNNGQEAIGENDISTKEPIRIKVSNNHEILEAKIQYSGNNKVELNRLNAQEFNVKFEFLNPKEGIIINFLHDGTPYNQIEFLGRIKGINQISNLNSGPRIIEKIAPYIIGILIAIITNALIVKLSDIIYNDSIFSYLVIISPLLLMIVLPYLFIRYRNGKLTKPTYIDILKRMMNEKSA